MPDTQRERPQQRIDRLRGTIGLFLGRLANFINGEPKIFIAPELNE